MLKTNREAGVSVIELMIGLTLSLVVLAFTLSGYIALQNNNRKTLKIMQLDYELRHTLSLMTEDIRRAGYWGNAKLGIGSGSNNNPFMAANSDVQIPNPNCILFTYDYNSDGTLPALNTAGGDKRFGYRLNNGVVQTRIVPAATFDCASNDWADMSDSKTAQITNLSFSFSPNPSVVVFNNGTDATNGTTTIRTVAISVTGSLLSDNTVIRTVSELVRIRNDKYTA